MRLITIAFVFLAASVALARPLPERDRTAETERWLAAAMVAEAGWLAEADHRAIYHVLRRQYRARSARGIDGSFLDTVRRYAAAFDGRTTRARSVWVRSLAEGFHDHADPDGWPDGVSWKSHRKLWAAVRRRAWACMRGAACRDPYRGRATHWGGTKDPPRGCMVALVSRDTINTFYGVDAACVRRRMKARREQRDR